MIVLHLFFQTRYHIIFVLQLTQISLDFLLKFLQVFVQLSNYTLLLLTLPLFWRSKFLKLYLLILNGIFQNWTFVTQILSFSLKIFQNICFFFQHFLKLFTLSLASLGIGFWSCIIFEMVGNLKFQISNFLSKFLLFFFKLDIGMESLFQM